jgi:hypothetical protein
MLSASQAPALRGEGGFTLVETIMAMITGVIVIGALFAILQVSLHQTAAISNIVQADRQGRTAMTKVVNELHSACLAPKFIPVQSGSKATELRFVNAYSNLAVIPSAAASAGEGAYEHRIKFVTVAGKGRLVDEAYPSLSTSSWPKFEFNKTAPSKTTLIGEAISETEKTPTEKIPVFQYYKYGKEYNQTSGESVSTLEQLPAEPTPAQVAAVRVSFTTAPEDTRFQAPLSAKTRVANEKIALSNQVTFAFSAPNAEEPVVAGPCQ